MIVYGSPDYPHGVQAMRDWINARLLRPISLDAQLIGREKDGTLLAVCAFSSYTGEHGDVELSVAAEPGSGTIGLVQAIFSYVFHQLKCARCTVKIREDNLKSVGLTRRVGFFYEGRQRKAADGKDLLLYGLLKEEFYGKFTQTPHAGKPDDGHQCRDTGEPSQPGNAVRQPDLQRQHA